MKAGDMLAAGSIGMPVERIEDLRLLRGRGQYVDDLQFDGMLHASILRSSIAHGYLRSIDASEARKMPGVRGVYTAEDVKETYGTIPMIPMRRPDMVELKPFEQPVIAYDKVRYVGEPLAIVIADSAALAEDALSAIAVDIEIFPAVARIQASLNGDVLLFESHGSNKAGTYVATKGDVTTVDAPYVRRERLSVQRHTAVSMEPRGVVAHWNMVSTNKLTVMGAAKVPYATRRLLAKCMGLPQESIDIVGCDVGGSFGVRGDFFPEDFLVPFAAHQVGRPVKWIEDRLENLLSASHSRESECEIEIVCDNDGRVLALNAQVFIDMGAYVRNSAEIAPRTAALFLAGPYHIPNIHVEALMVLSNKSPVGTYRAPGRFESDFFRERMFDIAARDLGIDRVEFRRRNLVPAAAMPYAIGKLTPSGGERDAEYDSGNYAVTLDRCLAEFGWEEKAKLQGKLIDGRYHGAGIGCFVDATAAGLRENARLVAGANGRVSLHTGSSNVGQGLETVCMQIASDVLGIPMSKIDVFHGSTTHLKEGFGTFSSRSVVLGGSAILDAATNFKAQIRAAAARRLQCSPHDIVIGEGLSASYGGKSVSFTDLSNENLSADGTFASSHRAYSYGAAAAHVAVDPKSGHVALIDYVMIHDLGRIINPLTIKGQAVGAIMQGLGGTLLENLQYDEQGQFLSGTLADYTMPTATDFPRIRTVELELSPSPHNPLGTKGAGECGIIPVGGVMANAIAAALAPFRVEPLALPLTPDRVWQLIQDAKSRSN